MGLHFQVGARFADSRRRDPLMPFRTTADEGFYDRYWWYQRSGLWLETYNVAAETRLFHDTWFKKEHGDPDGQNPGGWKAFGRTDNAYLTLAYPWGNIWVGRFKRNWGPLGQTGMMIGDNPTTYPQIGLDLGRGSLTFRFMAGQLESVDGRQRHIVGNRLDYRRGNFWASLGQSSLYSGEPAVLQLFNPLEFIFFDQKANNDRDELAGNLMVNGMFWARVGQATVYGEIVIDDFDLDARTGESNRTEVFPTIYHLSLGGRYLGVSDRLEFGFDYRRVSAWSYRTASPTPEVWTYLDRGLADPWSDYDRLTLRADLYPSVGGLRISPVFQFQRKGEGDYRLPFQERSPDIPGIFIGVKETTRRVALQGRYQPRREIFLEWDLGRSFISNAGHVDGSSEGRFSFLIRLGLTLELGLGAL